jgi:hypothetical protein
MNWTLLVLSLPTDNTTARMRAWRALKACGAAVLRDGVYLLPDSEAHRQALAGVADDVRRNDGQAQVLTQAECAEDLRGLFDRSAEYTNWLAEVHAAHALVRSGSWAEVQRAARRLRKSLAQLTAIDFFPGEAGTQAASAIERLECALAEAQSPDEPRARPGAIALLDRRRYQGRVWATRRRPWVDRLACGWLIRRFIDPQARFKWLASPADCPKRAIGFDFDGATFSHVGGRVTFETLLVAFALETPPLLRLGSVVHALDAGGAMPAEANGIERVLAGMRDAIADDDQLLLAASGVFEGLYIAFEREAA